MTEQPPIPAQDGFSPRVEAIDLQLEMQRSYLDYAMSVIVSRALPEVRDGLKPVHRRVLYAMYDGGYRPDRGYNKCARVVGDVMGSYHPHGDGAIYDTLVRLAQPWAMRYPLVDGQGNFGSPGNDPAAAMRYCVTADALVRTPGGTFRIGDLVPGAEPNTTYDIDLTVYDRNGAPVPATAFHHAGTHPVLRLRTAGGQQITGSYNHPLLCLVDLGGVPTLLWRLLEEIRPGDHVVLQRSPATQLGDFPAELEALAILVGAWLTEGFASTTTAGVNTPDEDYFDLVLRAFDAVVGGPRRAQHRSVAGGATLHELAIDDMTAFAGSPLAFLIGRARAGRVVPDLIWHGSRETKAAFLRSLFTAAGGAQTLPDRSIQIGLAGRSEQLARDVQQLLLEFGILSTVGTYPNGGSQVAISSRRDAGLFAFTVGFLGQKQDRLAGVVGGTSHWSRSLGRDRVPYLAEFLHAHGAANAADLRRLRQLDVDRIEVWEREGESILSRLRPEAAAVAEPLVDGRYAFAEVESVEPAGSEPVFSIRVDTEDHSFVTNGFVSHNTECRMQPLAMEMVRDIDKDTVDFSPNYDGKTLEPDILPSRFPNLLVNGSSGIAVGMATQIPSHNLREVAEGVQWLLANPDAEDDRLLAELLRRVKGPDFATRGLIMGTRGIEDAYRTGRGQIIMRAVVNVEEIENRTGLVITELPYQVNPDNLKSKIAELVDSGRVTGIADLRDDTSDKTGLRIVIILKRDAIAKVVLNNLYKHTQLQDTFGANMLALVDGVPRTLSLDKFVRHWVDHQIDVIVRRTRYLLAEAERQAHLYRGYAKALDALDEVIALIRASATVEDARTGLIDLLDIDEQQADAILAMQLRRLSAMERQKIIEELARLEEVIADLEAILASPPRQRQIVSEELAEIVEKYGDERRTRILPFDGDMNVEDLIQEEEVVVTITRDGYAKRTRVDAYRAQRRGGKGVRGAQLRSDDLVEHFFVTSTHNWVLFFTNLGRVYRAKAYELPEGSRDARGQHVANLLAFQPGEEIAQVVYLRTYEDADFLVLATRDGLVKKTRLSEYDSNRAGGVIAINLREGDELVSARLVAEGDDLLLVSRKGMSVRFTADDTALRPMGRATSGVTGMKFRGDDQLLSMDVVRDTDDAFVFVVTEGGYAKRTPVLDYRVQGRGGLGIKVAKLTEARGDLVAGMIVGEDDEVLVVMERGKVVRSAVSGVPAKGRDTMGVVFAKPDAGDRIIAVARNSERVLPDDDDTPIDDSESMEVDQELQSSNPQGSPARIAASEGAPPVQVAELEGAGGGADDIDTADPRSAGEPDDGGES